MARRRRSIVREWLARLRGQEWLYPEPTPDPETVGGIDFSRMLLWPAASAAHMATLERDLGKDGPQDYIAFMRRFNGGEGLLGEAGSYLQLWRAGDIGARNTAYRTREFASGFMLFGSDGEGLAYAFNYRVTPWTYVALPFVEMHEEFVEPIADTFMDFLRTLEAGLEPGG